MKYYIGQDAVIAENTLITYTTDKQEAVLMDEYDGVKIKRVGKSSFSGNSSLKTVILPDSVEEIGDDAFYDLSELTKLVVPGKLKKIEPLAFRQCPKLREINIRDLEVEKDVYDNLMQNSRKCSLGFFVSAEYPPNSILESLVKATSVSGCSTYIPQTIDRLFVEKKQQSEVMVSNRRTMTKQLFFTYSFTDEKEYISEEEAVERRFSAENREEYTHCLTECVLDNECRKGYYLPALPTAIFTFDDSLTKEIDGKYYLNATLILGNFFWQSMKHVVYESKDYYVYRRHYLSGNKQKNYFRRDIAVYNGKKLVTDIKAAKNVYGKYKLLSIL